MKLAVVSLSREGLVRASKFEFEYRFWIIGAFFGVAFALYNIDHTNFAVGLLRLIAPAIDPESAQGVFWLRMMFGCGALLVFLAAVLRTWATAYLRAEVVHDASQHFEALVADGPYRYVRNPLYLANLPMAAGIGVLASRLGWLLLVAGIWFFVYRLIFREEHGLLETQGESYRKYLAAVPRFWPALTPRVPAGPGKPRWGQAIAAEMFFWLFGAAILIFALTFNFKLMWGGFASSFVVYFIAVWIIKRRAAQSRPSA
jgi:protein-S-isoprenylcysteine O-methyltransferase Ste14